MSKRDKSNLINFVKNPSFIMITIFVLAVVFILVVNFTGNKINNSHEIDDLSYTEGWKLPDQSEITFPYADKSNESITITNVLPNYLSKQHIILFSSGYQPVKVEVDGQPLKVVGTFEGRITYATAYSYVSLTPEMANKEIKVTYFNQGGKQWMELYNIKIGDFNLIRQSAFSKDVIPVVSGIFLIVLAFLIFVLGLLQRESAVKVTNNRTLKFGLASSVTVMFAIWMMVDTETITLLFGANPSYVFVNIFSYLFIMGPWLLQIILTTNKKSILLRLLAMSGLIETFAIIIAAIFGYFNFFLYLTLSHMIGAFIEGAILFLSFTECKQRKDLGSKLLLTASVLLVVMSIVAAYTYYFKVSPNNVSFMKYGIGGYIIVMIYDLFHTFHKINKQYVIEVEAARVAAEEANRAKSNFLSSMSHDIRTPMNAIMGLTTIASTNIENQEAVKDALHKISLSSRHLLGLVNDILDMSKIESGNISLTMAEISLKELMDNLLNIIQPQIKSKSQKFDIILENVETEHVYCDGVRLNQILLNLLSNALKYTKEEGSIRVVMAQEKSPKGEKWVRTIFTVQDTGIGMTPEFVEHIFDSFSRADSYDVHAIEGTGLGMSITKHIVEMMEGSIAITSKLGGGSTFVVTLDFEKITEEEQNYVLPALNTLIVDDDKQLCLSAVSTLKDMGINADWTLKGEDAVEMVDEKAKGLNPYHVVLLDWQMPDMNGIETARQIRKRVGNDIPILLITAYDWTEIEKEAREAGINGFLSKPLFKSTLRCGLMHYIGENNEVIELIKDDNIDFTGKRILLSEDNEINWEIAQNILNMNGFIVDRAEDGLKCLEMFEQSKPGYYDLILMDIRMPRMNGYDSTEAIRALDRPDAKQIPILAMTADAFNEDIQHCLRVGMNGHISKPLDVKALLRLISNHLK